MELENIILNYREGFNHERIKSVYESIERLPLKIGSNSKTVMEIFPYASFIGMCPENTNAKITCDNLNELPNNYKSQIFFEGGGNAPQIWINEFYKDKPFSKDAECIERYTIFLAPYSGEE